MHFRLTVGGLACRSGAIALEKNWNRILLEHASNKINMLSRNVFPNKVSSSAENSTMNSIIATPD